MSSVPTASGPTTPGGVPPTDSRLELYKLEYERASIRYNDIYQALWQIFSYMSAITGALLAFGGDRFQSNLFWFLTFSPLVFWYWCTYEPLNRYGTNCGERLGAIEVELNRLYGTQMDHYRGFSARINAKMGLWGLIRHRVRHVVGPVFIVLTVIWAYHGFRAGRVYCAGAQMVREKSSEVKIVTIDADTIRKIIESSKPISQTPAGSPSNTSTNAKPN